MKHVDWGALLAGLGLGWIAVNILLAIAYGVGALLSV